VEASLSVSVLARREVIVLVNERKNAGGCEAKCDASGLSSGVYFYRLQAGDFTQTKRLTLLKTDWRTCRKFRLLYFMSAVFTQGRTRMVYNV